MISEVLVSRYNQVTLFLWAVVSDKFLGLVFMTGFFIDPMLTKYQLAMMFPEWNLMFCLFTFRNKSFFSLCLTNGAKQT